MTVQELQLGTIAIAIKCFESCPDSEKIIVGRTRLADRERLIRFAAHEELVQGRRFRFRFNHRTRLGAVACERKLWITGLNEARLQLYGRVVTLHVPNRESSNIHLWDVRATVQDSGTSADSFERNSFFSKKDLYHPLAFLRIYK